jgi:hypothetical protein
MVVRAPPEGGRTEKGGVRVGEEEDEEDEEEEDEEDEEDRGERERGCCNKRGRLRALITHNVTC